ncbi:MAG: VCBS repeat-containing protein [Elusimicrobia bacterium]|nr:VCBS repeat-containing protein [Elusimicrobiota bacterium]
MGLQIYLGGLRKIGVWLFLCPLGLGAIQWDLSDADAELDYETDLFSILEINVSGDFDGDTKNEIAYSFGTSGRAIYGSHFPAYSKLSSIRTTKLLNSDLSFKIKGTADLDGDSLDDWVISINAGEIEVVWGRSYPPAQLELSSPQNLIIKLPGPEHYFYYYTVGDFNGDGREDLVIGSPEIDPNPGRVYIFRGRSRAEMSGATFRTDDPSLG